jgi:hypothetical protein
MLGLFSSKHRSSWFQLLIVWVSWANMATKTLIAWFFVEVAEVKKFIFVNHCVVGSAAAGGWV